MTNSRQKGNLYEKEAGELYTRAGFLVWKPARAMICIGPGRWISGPNDIFEAFDLIATTKHELHLIQVKSDDAGACHARQNIDTIPLPREVVRVVMVRTKGKRYRFRVWVSTGFGWSSPFEVDGNIGPIFEGV